MPNASRKIQLGGNTATGWLKVLALAFMFCDHAGKMLMHNMTEMRLLGRIAFPLYCWCMVVGICYTRCPWKYVLRVALVGLISQPINMLALNHTWNEPCVFLTLTLGLLALWGMREKKFLSHIWAPIACLILAVITKTDYGWRGVLLMILLYLARESRGGIAAAMIGMSLYWGTTSSALVTPFGINLEAIYHLPGMGTLLPPFMRLQTMMLLALPLMLIRIPKKWDLHLPKWLGYAIYPAHLVILYAMEMAMGVVKVWPIDIWKPIAALFGL